MLKLHKILKVLYFLTEDTVLTFPSKMCISRIKAQNKYKSEK